MLDPEVDLYAVLAQLSDLHVEKDLLAGARLVIPARAIGVVLYGSRARTDFTLESDLDLLALVSTPAGSKASGHVTMSRYTPEQLESASGTLFGMHVERDGIILHDPSGQLQAILAMMRTPDPTEVFLKIRHLASVLLVTDSDRTRYLRGLARSARYFLRSAIYARALEQGNPCFSVRELAVRFNDPDVVTVLSSDPAIHGDDTIDSFTDLIRRLGDVVGPIESSPYDSLRELIVTEWDSDRERATIATLATAAHGQPFDYAQLPKVLL